MPPPRWPPSIGRPTMVAGGGQAGVGLRSSLLSGHFRSAGPVPAGGTVRSEVSGLRRRDLRFGVTSGGPGNCLPCEEPAGDFIRLRSSFVVPRGYEPVSPLESGVSRIPRAGRRVAHRGREEALAGPPPGRRGVGVQEARPAASTGARPAPAASRRSWRAASSAWSRASKPPQTSIATPASEDVWLQHVVIPSRTVVAARRVSTVPIRPCTVPNLPLGVLSNRCQCPGKEEHPLEVTWRAKIPRIWLSLRALRPKG